MKFELRSGALLDFHCTAKHLINKHKTCNSKNKSFLKKFKMCRTKKYHHTMICSATKST